MLGTVTTGGDVIIDDEDGWEIYKTPGKYYQIFAYNKISNNLIIPMQSTDKKYYVRDFSNEICDFYKMHIGNISNTHIRWGHRLEHGSIDKIIYSCKFIRQDLSCSVHNRTFDGGIKMIAAVILIKLNEVGLSDIKVKLFNGRETIRIDFKNEDQIAQFNFYFG